MRLSYLGWVGIEAEKFCWVCLIWLSRDGFNPDFSLICHSPCKTSKNIPLPIRPLPQHLREIHNLEPPVWMLRSGGCRSKVVT